MASFVCMYVMFMLVQVSETANKLSVRTYAIFDSSAACCISSWLILEMYAVCSNVCQSARAKSSQFAHVQS